MAGYGAPCTQGPRAANDSGSRKASAIKHIVIHSAEASDDVGEDTTAEGVANYFARSTTQASTQLAVDRDSCVRMLPDLVIPWGASGANTTGLHVEICGRARWRRAEWMSHPTMLERAAWKTAMWCWRYDIPRRWLTVSQLKAGRKGLTTHADVNAAFKRGTHWDPGSGFPGLEFLGMMERHYAAIEAERKR